MEGAPGAQGMSVSELHFALPSCRACFVLLIDFRVNRFILQGSPFSPHVKGVPLCALSGKWPSFLLEGL